MKPREGRRRVLLVEPVISLQAGRQDSATVSGVGKGVFPSVGT